MVELLTCTYLARWKTRNQKRMRLSQINFEGEVLIINDINLSVLPKDQILYLWEDIMCVTYTNNITLDIGWYPGLNPKGSFVINLINQKGWDEPFYSTEIKFKDFQSEIPKIIAMCLEEAKK